MFLDSYRASERHVIDPRLERLLLVELDRLDRLARLYPPHPSDQGLVTPIANASGPGARGEDDAPRSHQRVA